MKQRREYQIEAVPKLVRLKRAMSLLPPGAGKTVIGLDTALGWAEQSESQLPVIINSTRNGLGTWINQLEEWYPELAGEAVIVSGTPAKRQKIWKLDRRFFVCTYDTVRLDLVKIPPAQLARRFLGIIADECHKRRNHRNATSKAFLHVSRYIPYLLLTTGSHMLKGPVDLFALFQLVNPQLFRSYWKFVHTYHFVEEGMYGKEIGEPRNVENLVDIIVQNGYYKSRKDLKGQLPDKNRVAITVEMTQEQQQVYHDLTTEMMHWMQGAQGEMDVILAPTPMTLILRVRQLLVCPKILNPEFGMGAAFEDLLGRLEEEPHMHIVTPFAKAILHIIEALLDAGYDPNKIFYIRGGMKPGQAQKYAHMCCECRGIMISSLLAAESYSLSTCTTAYFLGYDWTPDQNYQAEDRIVRADSVAEGVNIYYARYKGTLDDELLEVLDAKVMKIRTVNTILDLKALTKKTNLI